MFVLYLAGLALFIIAATRLSERVAQRQNMESEQHPEAADNEDREGYDDENNVEIIRALNRIAHEQQTSRHQEHAYERKKGSRERLTIGGIFLAAVVAILALIVAHSDTSEAIKEASTAANTQHIDTEAALRLAAEANHTAQETAAAQIREMAAQSKAMQGQLDEIYAARAQSMQSDRARFVLGEPTLNKKMANDPAPTISYPLFNIGRSAAIVSGLSIECEVSEGSGPTYREDAYRYAVFAVGAGASFDFGVKSPCQFPRLLTPDDYAAISIKTKGFLLKGFIRFKDVYGQSWTQHIYVAGFSDGVFYPLPNGRGSEETKDPTPNQNR